MQEIFTQDLDETYCKTKNGDEMIKECSPREIAVEFIRQFARAYSCESSLCSDLCGYIVN